MDEQDVERRMARAQFRTWAHAYDEACASVDRIRQYLGESAMAAHDVGVKDRELAEITIHVMRKGLTRGRIQQLRNLNLPRDRSDIDLDQYRLSRMRETFGEHSGYLPT